jgi:hypothetical protein
MGTSTWARGHRSTSRPSRSGGHTSANRCGTCADAFSTSDAGRAGRSCTFVREGSVESGSTTHRLPLRYVGGEALQMSRCGRLLNLKGLARSTPSSFSEADSVSSETGRVLGDCSARCIPLRPIAAASSLHRGLLTRTPTIGSTPSGTCHEDAWAGSSESVFGIDRSARLGGITSRSRRTSSEVLSKAPAGN